MAKKTQRSRGQIEPRGDKKYLVRVYIGQDPSGKRKYSSKIVNGTYKQAEGELTKMLREVDTQTFVEPAKQTVQEFLAGWLKGKHGIATKTLLDYEHRMKKDVYPYIGGLRLDKVSPQTISLLYGKLRDERKLAPRSIRYTHRILHQAFEKAVEWSMLYRNPTAKAELPKVRKSEAQAMSHEDMRALLAHTEANDDLHPLWLLLLTTALRPQEALALKWEDVDTATRTITVQRAIVEVEKGVRVVSDSLKTESSRRTITVPKTTIEALQVHKARQATEIMQRGPKYDRQGFVFASSTGRFLDISNVRRAWKRALVAADLPAYRLYDSRHTHITHLLDSGANVRAVAARAGHANPVMTLNVYAHLLKGADEALADTMDTLLQARA